LKIESHLLNKCIYVIIPQMLSLAKKTLRWIVNKHNFLLVVLKLDGLFSLLELCNKLFRGQKFHIMTKRYVAYSLYF
jgi:hypothetical protein